MHVTLYGATGRAGSRILKELIKRNHKITAITREQGNSIANGENDNVHWVFDNLTDIAKTADVIKGSDAVISAYAPPPENTDALVSTTMLLASAVAESKVPRLLVVGGAGGLLVAPGVTLLDSGNLPPEWQPIALSHVKTYQARQSTGINWTYLSPAAYFEPGERTGQYQSDTDKLVISATGQSKISMEDYAIAMVDELEAPKHPKARFAVGW